MREPHERWDHLGFRLRCIQLTQRLLTLQICAIGPAGSSVERADCGDRLWGGPMSRDSALCDFRRRPGRRRPDRPQARPARLRSEPEPSFFGQIAEQGEIDSKSLVSALNLEGPNRIPA